MIRALFINLAAAVLYVAFWAVVGATGWALLRPILPALFGWIP